MKIYKIFVDPKVDNDISKAVEYYENQQAGLSQKFIQAYDDAINILKGFPHYQIRYDSVRCFPIKKFPYMIHFTIDENNRLVNIYALIHTSLDPEENWIE